MGEKSENRIRDIKILCCVIRQLEYDILDPHALLFVSARDNEDKEVIFVSINVKDNS